MTHASEGSEAPTSQHLRSAGRMGTTSAGPFGDSPFDANEFGFPFVDGGTRPTKRLCNRFELVWKSSPQ